MICFLIFSGLLTLNFSKEDDFKSFSTNLTAKNQKIFHFIENSFDFFLFFHKIRYKKITESFLDDITFLKCKNITKKCCFLSTNELTFKTLEDGTGFTIYYNEDKMWCNNDLFDLNAELLPKFLNASKEYKTNSITIYNHDLEVNHSNDQLKSSNDYRYVLSQGDYQIDIDLSDYDMKNDAWAATVAAYGPVYFYHLFFQLSKEIKCPGGFICDTSKFNTYLSWLCAGGSCTGYGKLNQNVSTYILDDNILNGIVAEFQADEEYEKSLQILYECDLSYKIGSLRLPFGVTLNNNKNSLKYTVGMESACPQPIGPTPSPLPFVRIPKPLKPDTPSHPTIETSETSFFFVRNSTHYTHFSLDKLDQGTFKGNLPIIVDGVCGPLYTEFSPWNLLECPKEWNCPDFNMSNLWGCWIDEDMKRYCHPIGDKRIYTSLTPLAPNNLNRGVILRYGGAYGISAEFRIECDPINGPPNLPLFESYATFHRSLNGPEISYNLSSSIVCPCPFYNPSYPTVLPSPTPSYDPSNKVSYSFHSPIIHGQKISFDLSTLQQVEQWVVLMQNINNSHITGSEDTIFELDLIIFNPTSQIGCPDGYNCSSLDPANTWKCNQNKECFSIGDSRYGLSIELNNNFDLSQGIQLYYKGGYAGYSFLLDLKCKNSQTSKLLDFIEVNMQDPQYPNIIRLNAFSNIVCPISAGIFSLGFSPGAIFILILSIISILYLFFGVLYSFFKKGILEMPNVSFWKEFFECLKAGITFLFCCGSRDFIAKDEQYTSL